MTHAPDATLMIFSIAVYAVGATALITYFFSRDAWLRNAGAALVIAGCAAQFVQFFVRYELTGVWPFLNLYGSLSLFAAMGVLIFIIFAFRYNLWFAGGFVVAIAAVFLAYGVTWNEGTLPAVPSLQSYWAKIHVPLVVSAYGAFLVAFVLSVLYLVRYYVERGLLRRPSVALAAAADNVGSIAMHAPTPSYMSAEGAPQDASFIAVAAAAGNPLAAWLLSLPSLAQLDVLVYRVVAVGLPLLTLGIITGAMWAREAWGAYWQWDPKETAALFSWIIYAIYMHLHTRNAWRGLRCSWVSVIGFASIIFCYLGVNIWISGLHSYKM
jgi:cytochrome c-type biogenesis protein CcsB